MAGFLSLGRFTSLRPYERESCVTRQSKIDEALGASRRHPARHPRHAPVIEAGKAGHTGHQGPASGTGLQASVGQAPRQPWATGHVQPLGAPLAILFTQGGAFAAHPA
jgi:hypothetical protein